LPKLRDQNIRLGRNPSYRNSVKLGVGVALWLPTTIYQAIKGPVLAILMALGLIIAALILTAMTILIVLPCSLLGWVIVESAEPPIVPPLTEKTA
jgi:hypothetical protein